MRELHDNIDIKPGIFPAAAITDNTPFVSQIEDMQNLQSAEFTILTGALADADATFTVLAEEGEQANLADHTAVDDRDLLGLETQASFDFSPDNKVLKLGFRPSGKRYKRVTVTPANNTGQQHRQRLRRRRLGYEAAHGANTKSADLGRGRFPQAELFARCQVAKG